MTIILFFFQKFNCINTYSSFSFYYTVSHNIPSHNIFTIKIDETMGKIVLHVQKEWNAKSSQQQATTQYPKLNSHISHQTQFSLFAQVLTENGIERKSCIWWWKNNKKECTSWTRSCVWCKKNVEMWIHIVAYEIFFG